MAVYSKLLLSAGGGIVSTTQQADQVKNTATVLIGLFNCVNAQKADMLILWHNRIRIVSL